ncbi:MAG: DUF2330 domain-containing protein [Sandaracinus sp.]
MNKLLVLGSGAALAVAVCVDASPAAACGGCFHPPEGNPTEVNAHRMVLTVSPEGTTLWDQIVYTGDPEEFAWVLPIAGTAQVELADNGFFEALSSETLITMRAPAPPRLTCDDPCGGFGPFGFGASAGAPRREDSGMPVTVYHQGVVGPYETATIGSEDPAALVAWLHDNGYAVDDSIMPVIDHYVAQHMSFAVLRLRPGADIDRMQPVRVTTPGLSTTLPLRMVRAGVSIDLDLELFVFAESRMEASSFGNAEVDRAAITYDWNARTFDYDARFEDALFAGDGVGTNWVTEYAQPVTSWTTLETYTSRGADGTVNSAAEDVAVVRAALPADAYLTRLRTRLTPNDLRDDLTLRMSEGGDLGTLIDVTHELNRAPEPDCATVCVAGGGTEPAGSITRGAGSMYRRCSAGVGHEPTPLALLALAGALGLVARRRRS